MLRHVAALLPCLVWFALPAVGSAQDVPQASEAAEPIYMEADKLGYDREQAIVVAKGNVEIASGARVLFADTLYYYQNEDVVKAKGQVSLMEADGHVLFSDEVVLKRSLKAGVVRQFRARLSDDSAFAAAEARRLSETRQELHRAVYSPCRICSEDGAKAAAVDGEARDAPLWQIKAGRVVIDQEAQKVAYHDATFEVEGFPVAYTPYFSHPTPDANRKSGFLQPAYGQSSNLGTSLRLPYYFNIAPNQDATLTPWLTSEEGPVLLGEYRYLADQGELSVKASGTFPEQRDNATGRQLSGNEFRGHVFTQGQYRFSRNWRAGFDINRASDDTYLRRYGFGDFQTLNSRAYGEYVRGRDYGEVHALAFQGLEVSDDSGLEPLILPEVTLHMESEPLRFGGRFGFHGNVLALTRDEGAATRRLSTALDYRLPYITDGGHVWKAEMGLRADVYSQSDLPQPRGEAFSGTDERVVPHAALSWRYPLITQLGSTRMTVEPQVKLVAHSEGHNPETIANEDSQNPEFNELNLFANNRFAGLDRIEEGTRAVVGVRARMQGRGGRTFSGFLGQDVQLSGDNPFPVGRDPRTELSDIVGKLGYESRRINLDGRYRLDRRDAALRRGEVRGSLQWGRLGVGTRYVRIDEDPVLDDRHDIIGNMHLQVLDDVRLNAFGSRNLLAKDFINVGSGIHWAYDCITVDAQFVRDFTRDRDLEPDTRVSLRLGLKNLTY